MISVLLPVYNTNGEHLKECIESILAQSLPEFEIIIVNNGSTNNDTIATLNEYFIRYGSIYSREMPKIKIYTAAREFGKKNLSVALNYGLAKCSFDYVARMDSDDVMSSERLYKQFAYMIRNPDVDILGCQLQNMYDDQQITNHPLKIPQNYYKFSTHFLNHPCVMFKKDRILALGGYQETPDHIPEDFLLWVKALKNGYIIDNLPDILVRYRNKKDGTLSLIDSQYPEWYAEINKAVRE